MRRLRCFVPKQRQAQCRADLGQSPGHTLENVHKTNHQSPITMSRRVLPGLCARYVCRVYTASRLSGLVRRLRCFVPKQRHAQCRADLGQGPGHTLKNVHTTNHQLPITNHNEPDICFTICLFISPDLDGYRAPKGINPTRPTRSRNPNTKPLITES